MLAVTGNQLLEVLQQREADVQDGFRQWWDDLHATREMLDDAKAAGESSETNEIAADQPGDSGPSTST